jgi:hypothetical protein
MPEELFRGLRRWSYNLEHEYSTLAVAPGTTAPSWSRSSDHPDAFWRLKSIQRLARRASDCLRGYPQVRVQCADAQTIDAGSVDAVLVNAGFMEPSTIWLDRLTPSGRLILPLTFSILGTTLTKGPVFCLEKREGSFLASYVSFAMIYGDPSVRDPVLNDLLHAQSGRYVECRAVAAPGLS